MNICLHLNQQMFRCFLFCLLVFTVLLVFGLFGASWMCRLMKFHLDTFNILVVQSLQTCLKGETAFFFCRFPLKCFQNTLFTKCITEWPKHRYHVCFHFHIKVSPWFLAYLHKDISKISILHRALVLTSKSCFHCRSLRVLLLPFFLYFCLNIVHFTCTSCAHAAMGFK